MSSPYCLCLANSGCVASLSAAAREKLAPSMSGVSALGVPSRARRAPNVAPPHTGRENIRPHIRPSAAGGPLISPLEGREECPSHDGGDAVKPRPLIPGEWTALPAHEGQGADPSDLLSYKPASARGPPVTIPRTPSHAPHGSSQTTPPSYSVQ